MGGSASGPATTRRAFSGTGGTTVDTPVLSQAEADQLASGWFGEMALSYVEGHGTVHRRARPARRDAGQDRRLGAGALAAPIT